MTGLLLGAPQLDLTEARQDPHSLAALGRLTDGDDGGSFAIWCAGLRDEDTGDFVSGTSWLGLWWRP